jgi:fumarate reductase subunit C
MTEKAAYTEFHPRWHRTPVSTWWWMKRIEYVKFILREVSSVFVAWFVVFLLLLVHAVTAGPDAYKDFLAWSAHPAVIALNLVSFVLVTFHAVTWFNLAPQAMVVRMKGKRVPGMWIAGSNYVLWALVSLLVLFLLL